MASAKKRLSQISSQLKQPTPSSSSSTPQVGIFTTTHTHSPGNTIATITFSNPTKLNVASGAHLEALISTCQQLGQDDSLRAVILTGALPAKAGQTPSFIGGADVQELNALSSSDEAKAYIMRVHRACAALQTLPVPVIARVHGFALGAGLELMAACDLRVASGLSQFGMPEVKIGLPCVAEAALFPGLIGVGRTKRLVYLAENIDARTALDWGLIERVVAGDGVEALDQAVQKWVDTLVKMGPQSIRIQKRLMRRWENANNIEEAIMAGVDALGESYADGGKQAKEYIKPFLGRKK